MTVDDGGVVLADCHLVAGAEHVDSGLFELETRIFADDESACQDGDVLQHSFPAVAETGSLDGANLELSAQAVDDERSECLAVNVFCDDEQRTSALYGRLEDGQEVLQVGDLLIVDEDVGVLHDALHLLCVGDEVRAEVATVELHAFDHADSGVAALSLFDGDDAVFADLLHGVGQELTNLGVVVGAYCCHLLYLLIVGSDRLGLLLDVLNDSGYCLVDTALQVHGVGTCCHVLQAFANNGLSQYGGCCCAVACIVAGLACHALHELCASVLEGIGQFHFLCHRDAVLRNLRCAELLLDDNVATLRAESHLNCICQLVHALLHLVASLEVEFDIFCHFIQFLIHNS